MKKRSFAILLCCVLTGIYLPSTCSGQFPTDSARRALTKIVLTDSQFAYKTNCIYFLNFNAMRSNALVLYRVGDNVVAFKCFYDGKLVKKRVPDAKLLKSKHIIDSFGFNNLAITNLSRACRSSPGESYYKYYAIRINGTVTTLGFFLIYCYLTDENLPQIALFRSFDAILNE